MIRKINKISEKFRGYPEGEFLLTIVAAISYLLFQFLLMYSATTIDGKCLYTFWLPYQNDYFSPYWLSVVLVSVLVIWASTGLLVTILKNKRKWWRICYFCVATFVLGWWLYDMSGFWQAMQYERGLISAEQYYKDFPIAKFSERHQCVGLWLLI